MTRWRTRRGWGRKETQNSVKPLRWNRFPLKISSTPQWFIQSYRNTSLLLICVDHLLGGMKQLKSRQSAGMAMASPPAHHLSPLMKIFNLLSIFLGHNFDMNLLEASAGHNFEDRSDSFLRILVFALISGSYPIAMIAVIIVSGNRYRHYGLAIFAVVILLQWKDGLSIEQIGTN